MKAKIILFGLVLSTFGLVSFTIRLHYYDFPNAPTQVPKPPIGWEKVMEVGLEEIDHQPLIHIAPMYLFNDPLYDTPYGSLTEAIEMGLLCRGITSRTHAGDGDTITKTAWKILNNETYTQALYNWAMPIITAQWKTKEPCVRMWQLQGLNAGKDYLTENNFVKSPFEDEKKYKNIDFGIRLVHSWFYRRIKSGIKKELLLKYLSKAIQDLSIPTDGKIQLKYANGNLAQEGMMIKGVPEGNWKTYSTQGKLLADMNYKKGVRVGSYQIYFADGSPKYNFNYDGTGKVIGTQLYYFKNKTKRAEYKYENDGKLSRFDLWYDNGTCQEENIFGKDLTDVLSYASYEYYTTEEKDEYDRNIRTKQLKEAYIRQKLEDGKTGIIKKSFSYKQEVLEEERYSFKYLKKEQEYTGSGKKTTYFANGKISSLWEYQISEKSTKKGSFTEYDEDGKVKSNTIRETRGESMY